MKQVLELVELGGARRAGGTSGTNETSGIGRAGGWWYLVELVERVERMELCEFGGTSGTGGTVCVGYGSSTSSMSSLWNC